MLVTPSATVDFWFEETTIVGSEDWAQRASWIPNHSCGGMVELFAVPIAHLSGLREVHPWCPQEADAAHPRRSCEDWGSFSASHE